jgi:hypothetical protein
MNSGKEIEGGLDFEVLKFDDNSKICRKKIENFFFST